MTDLRNLTRGATVAAWLLAALLIVFYVASCTLIEMPR